MEIKRIFKFFKRLLSILSKRYLLESFLFILGILLFLLIDKYWISPDEYFYVSLGRSIAAKLQGHGCLECIDTAHTPLLPFLISLGYIFLKEDSVIFYRIIPIIFTLTTIYYIYKCLKIIIKNKNTAILALLGIFLFPGFFTFVEKVNIDIISLFFTVLIIYFLLKKEKYWKISLSLIFVLLSKEYTAIFSGLIISTMIIVDSIKKNNVSFAKKIKEIIKNHIIVYLPMLIITALFLIPQILPYPRMLDNLILEIFGSVYYNFGQQLKGIINGFSNIGSLPHNDNIFISIINTNVRDVLTKENIFQKICKIYLSSFQEGDVNIIAIPLVITGIVIRIKFLLKYFKKKYIQVRPDIIYLIFLLEIIYFNIRVASGDHGFRIVFPIIIPSIYFIYYACLHIVKINNYYAKLIFSLSFIFFILIYQLTSNYHIESTSSLPQNNFLHWFISYKIYINSIIYLSIALYILLIGEFKNHYKYHFLALILITVCAYKILPFAIDKSLSVWRYGQDYDLIKSRPFLEKIENKNEFILTNVRPYQYYYYANSVNFPNIDKPTLPIIRKTPKEIYSDQLVLFNSTQNIFNMNNLCKNKIDYLFYLNADNEKLPIYKKIQDSPMFEIIKEYYLPQNNRYNWGLYLVNKKLCQILKEN